MLVCLCHSYSEHEIEEACRDASSVEEVCGRLGEQLACTACVDYIAERLPKRAEQPACERAEGAGNPEPDPDSGA